MKRPMKYVLAGLAALMLIACSPTAPRNNGVYLLLDTSGTYSEELKKAQTIILFALSRLQPTDSFAVARIDTGSFSEKDIIAKATFDDRPSAANNQKRAFAAQIKNFVELSKPATHTDITGGLLQAIEFLNEKNSGRKTILIFSDLQEDLAQGYIRDVPLDLKGFEVVALNVTKLRSDNMDPREYLSRVDNWRERVEKSGGRFRMINDLERLDGIL
ncbi:MAG: VWA domain-containing protein [Steroidobacter sp.]